MAKTTINTLFDILEIYAQLAEQEQIVRDALGGQYQIYARRSRPRKKRASPQTRQLSQNRQNPQSDTDAAQQDAKQRESLTEFNVKLGGADE